MQVQIKEENQTRDQNLTKQIESLQTPLTRQTTFRNIEQETDKNIVPKLASKPTVTEIKIPIYPDPLIKPPPRPLDVKTQDDRKINLDLDLEVNKDFGENAPYQEGIISEIYHRPHRYQLLEPPELADLVNTNNIVKKVFAKANRYGQDPENYTKKGIERYLPPCDNKGYTNGIFKQPIFQISISLSYTKQNTTF